MNRLLSVAALILGGLGVLVAITAIVTGIVLAVRVNTRVHRTATIIDERLTDADERLDRVEQRVSTIRAELAHVQGEVTRLAAENPELPRLKLAIDQLLERLKPTLDNAAALAESLRAVAVGLRAADDLAMQFGVERPQPSRAQIAAEGIDQAATVLSIPQSRIDAIKSSLAVRLTQDLITWMQEIGRGSEMLARALSETRAEITVTRERIVIWEGEIRFWIVVATVIHTLGWLWIGIGQLALISWARRS